jgi:hypothetical protein
MRRVRSSWAPALLLLSAVRAIHFLHVDHTDLSQVAVEGALNLHSGNVRPNIEGKRIEDLISGTDRSQGNLVARMAQNGFDANALLNGVAQGQNQGGDPGRVGSDITTNNVGADLANQIAGGGSTGINDILNSLNGQDQSASTNDSTPQEQGQMSAQGAASQNTGNVGPGDINSSNIAADLANQLAPPAGSSENPVKDPAGDLANQVANNGFGQVPQQGGNNAQPMEPAPAMETTPMEATPPMEPAPAVEPAPAMESSSTMAEPEGQKTEPTGAEASGADVMTVFPPGQSPLPEVTPIGKVGDTSAPMAEMAPMETATSAAEAEPMPTEAPMEGTSATVGISPTLSLVLQLTLFVDGC